MSDLGELKRRVDSAVELLSTAQDGRRNQHDKLVQLLADLEVKFDARHEELNYCRARISDLEQANNHLADLLNTVIRLIESGAVDDPNDPLFRASQMAVDLVNMCANDPVPVRSETLEGLDGVMVSVDATMIEDLPMPAVAETVSADPTPRQAAPHQAPSAAADLWQELPEPGVEDEALELEIIDVPESGNTEAVTAAVGMSGDQAARTPAVEGRFEEVSDEELEVEKLLDADADESEMPYDLVAAVRAARAGTDSAAGASASADSGLADTLAKVAEAVRSSQADDPPPAVAQGAAASHTDTVAMGEVAAMDIPGVDTVVGFEIVDIDEEPAISLADPPVEATGDADIKALMSRIQIAAEKARARTDTGEGDEPPHEGHGRAEDEAGTG